MSTTRRAASSLILLLILVVARPAAAHVVRGNVALADTVYLSLVDAPTRVSERRARRIARKVQTFLRDAGYEIATATASVSESGEMFLLVDEGRLEKVVLPGQSALKALAFQVITSLPDKVFNRPLLDKELARIHEEYGIEVDRYEVVQVDEAPLQTFPELSALTEDWVPPPARHRLEVYLREETLGTGMTLHVDYRSPDGAITRARLPHPRALQPRLQGGAAPVGGPAAPGRDLRRGRAALRLARRAVGAVVLPAPRTTGVADPR